MGATMAGVDSTVFVIKSFQKYITKLKRIGSIVTTLAVVDNVIFMTTGCWKSVFKGQVNLIQDSSYEICRVASHRGICSINTNSNGDVGRVVVHWTSSKNVRTFSCV